MWERCCARNIRKAELSSTVRSDILDAALSIIETQGLEQLTQPRIARAAGVRQSHLTYYFPRRTDLLSALLDHSHQRVEQEAKRPDFLGQLVRLLFDPRRARFFLAVIVETSDTPEGRAVMAAHMSHFSNHLAKQYKRDPQDAAILGFVAELRGLSVQNLVSPVPHDKALEMIGQAIIRYGLSE